MKITAIKQQVKRTDRYSIYVEGKYACSFSEAELLKLGLHSGQEMSEEEFNNLKDDSVRDKGYTRALDLLSRRPRSEWELRDYLKRKDYDEETSDQIIDKLNKLGYVDDYDFAKRWVENRRLLKSTSKRKLVQELKQKRIADEIIDRVLEQDGADEHQVIKELIEKKKRQTKYQDKTKLMQYLAGQGFSYSDIKKIIDEMS